MFEVCNNGASHGLEFMVRQVALLCGLLYDFGYFAIMDVAYIWKNMVFDLVVQSARKPIDDFVFGSKIRRGVKLVDGPGVFDFAYFVRDWVCGFIHNMRELEYNAENESCRIMHDEET